MITNGSVTINKKAYKAWVFEQNKIKADDMGERFDCTVTVRIPIARNEIIPVKLGDCITACDEEWKVVKLTVNRTGSNPHYRLLGAR